MIGGDPLARSSKLATGRLYQLKKEKDRGSEEAEPEAEESDPRSPLGWIPLWCGRCLHRAPITRWNSSAGRTRSPSTAKRTLVRAHVGTVKRLFDARTPILRITAYLQWPTESKVVGTVAGILGYNACAKKIFFGSWSLRGFGLVTAPALCAAD